MRLDMESHMEADMKADMEADMEEDIVDIKCKEKHLMSICSAKKSTNFLY
jgi:hypothetical protein